MTRFVVRRDEPRRVDVEAARERLGHEVAEPPSGPISVTRSRVVDNAIYNDAKHTYRIHGISYENYAHDNVFGGGGYQSGDQPIDDSDIQTVNDNVFCHEEFVPPTDMFDPEPTGEVINLTATGNLYFSDAWTTSFGSYEDAEPPGLGWLITSNTRGGDYYSSCFVDHGGFTLPL